MHSPRHHSVIIAGGGPTGMLLACLLLQRNVDCIVLEKRPAVSAHSRSIGIHPPSLELLEKAGVIDPVLDSGNRVDTGIAFTGKQKTGVIEFSQLKTRFPFILTLSQSETEKILETRLHETGPGRLHHNKTISRIQSKSGGCEIETSDGSLFSCDFLIGCDGKNSTVREQAGIQVHEKKYPDTYIMGDFEDTAAQRNEALVYLSPDGLVESFPHGQNLRRWVIKTDTFVENPGAGKIAETALKRTGTAPDPETNEMLSSFGVMRLLAKEMVKGRIILAGDAAHVVSPIGGQGMNLGWLDAGMLAGIFPDPDPQKLQAYDRIRRKKAVTAARRAAFNMILGRKYRSRFLRKMMVKTMLSAPFKMKLMKQFTMHGLD